MSANWTCTPLGRCSAIKVSLVIGVNGESAWQASILRKLVSYEREDAEKSDFRFLWRLLRSTQTKDSFTFELNPLYYYEHQDGEGSYWTILGGLLGLETTADQTRKIRVLWIF